MTKAVKLLFILLELQWNYRCSCHGNRVIDAEKGVRKKMRKKNHSHLRRNQWFLKELKVGFFEVVTPLMSRGVVFAQPKQDSDAQIKTRATQGGDNFKKSDFKNVVSQTNLYFVISPIPALKSGCLPLLTIGRFWRMRRARANGYRFSIRCRLVYSNLRLALISGCLLIAKTVEWFGGHQNPDLNGARNLPSGLMTDSSLGGKLFTCWALYHHNSRSRLLSRYIAIRFTFASQYDLSATSEHSLRHGLVQSSVSDSIFGQYELFSSLKCPSNLSKVPISSTHDLPVTTELSLGLGLVSSLNYSCILSDFLKLSPPLCRAASYLRPKQDSDAQIKTRATQGGDNFKKSDFKNVVSQTNLYFVISPIPGSGVVRVWFCIWARANGYRFSIRCRLVYSNLRLALISGCLLNAKTVEWFGG
eukprot:sb/3465080/